MDKQQFIEEVAKYVKKYAPQYDVKVYSPIIAQACLESGYGKSELATNAHNYFGLKYSKTVSKGPAYIKVGSEQNPDGSYESSVMEWCSFGSLEEGVEGYFKFLFTRGTNRYMNLKGVTDPTIYLNRIKEDGYATSINYVINLLKVIKDNNLIKFDEKSEEHVAVSAGASAGAQRVEVPNKPKFTNSPLVCYTKISPSKTSPRNHDIDTISIHCMAGNLTVETCGNVFQKREASSNYGIGSDGRIGMYVEECDRSWCTSNRENDNRAVTIEVANDGLADTGWHVSDKAMEALIKLCADICKRNHIKELKWLGDKNLIGQVDKQNMTVHRWFAAKACPGDYLYNKHGYIAAEVNKLLGAGTPVKPVEPPKPVTPQPAPSAFLVKVTTEALNIRKQPNTNAEIVGCIKDQGVYTIVATQGSWGLLKSFAANKDGWISLNYCERK